MFSLGVGMDNQSNYTETDRERVFPGIHRLDHA